MDTKATILQSMKIHKSHFEDFGVNQIGLFGSYVRDEQSNKSDIDILVNFVPEKETFDNFMELYDYLEKVFKNKKIEVVTTNGLSPHIGQNILKEVVYA